MTELKLLTPGRLEVLRDQSTLLEHEQEELFGHIDAQQQQQLDGELMSAIDRVRSACGTGSEKLRNPYPDTEAEA